MDTHWGSRLGKLITGATIAKSPKTSKDRLRPLDRSGKFCYRTPQHDPCWVVTTPPKEARNVHPSKVPKELMLLAGANTAGRYTRNHADDGAGAKA
jgi:hypothetical protein